MEENTKLRYSDLTPFQKKSICNGCGGKGGWFNPPEFLFHASCNQHDFYYWRGGDETDRKEADETFYKFMKKDVSEAKWFRKPFYGIAAYTYYKSVRVFGKKFFNYCDSQKTKENVVELSEVNRETLKNSKNIIQGETNGNS